MESVPGRQRNHCVCSGLRGSNLVGMSVAAMTKLRLEKELREDQAQPVVHVGNLLKRLP